MACCVLGAPQAGHQRGGEQRRHQLQSDDGEQVSGLADGGASPLANNKVCVASRWAAQQQRPVEGHHDERAAHDAVQGAGMTALPDMDGAGHTGTGQDHH